jgi:hypothetical protein
MTVDLNRVGDSMEAHIVMTYDVLYIDTLKKDAAAFTDDYKTASRERLFDLTGSDTMTKSFENIWKFNFSTHIGLRRIVTSKYALRYFGKNSQTPITFWGNLKKNEEVFQYHNDGLDVIGEIVIPVSSSSLPFVNAQAKQSQLPNNSKDVSVFKPGDSDSLITYVARFYDLKDCENAQLKVVW